MLAALALLAAAALAPPTAPPGSEQGSAARSSRAQAAIEDAADGAAIPRALLLALSYAEARWSARDGALFELRNPLLAAQLAGVAPARAQSEPAANASAAAAELRAAAAPVFARYADLREDRLEDWFEPLMLLSGSRTASRAADFAASVYRVLRDGASALDDEGASIALTPQDLALPAAWLAPHPFGDASFLPAANYSEGREGNEVQLIVIHDTEGDWSGTVRYFSEASTQASAHFVVRSDDGRIVQQVAETDTAWHAGYWELNQHSIGIEHEAYADAGELWFTEAMYRSSAALVRFLCDLWGIPEDRQHIIGHFEVPDPFHPGLFGGSGHHSDPCVSWSRDQFTWHNVTACHWDWDRYMKLVTGRR